MQCIDNIAARWQSTHPALSLPPAFLAHLRNTGTNGQECTTRHLKTQHGNSPSRYNQHLNLISCCSSCCSSKTSMAYMQLWCMVCPCLVGVPTLGSGVQIDRHQTSQSALQDRTAMPTATAVQQPASCSNQIQTAQAAQRSSSSHGLQIQFN